MVLKPLKKLNFKLKLSYKNFFQAQMESLDNSTKHLKN